MIADVVSIEKKTEKLISSYPENPLSDEKAINLFLDRINKIRKPIIKATAIIKELDELLLLITWINVKSKDEEKKVKEILLLASSFHKQVIRDFAFLNKILPKNMFGDTLRKYKCSVDDFEDSISEVENVIFNLRKDKELMNMIENL